MQVGPLHTWIFRGRRKQRSRMNPGRRKWVSTFSQIATMKYISQLWPFSGIVQKCQKRVHKMICEGFREGQSFRDFAQKISLLKIRHHFFSTCNRKMSVGESGLPAGAQNPTLLLERAKVCQGLGRTRCPQSLIRGGVQFKDGECRGRSARDPGPPTPLGSAGGPNVPCTEQRP